MALLLLRRKGAFVFPRLQPLASSSFKRWDHTLVEGGLQSHLYPEMDTDSVIPPVDTSKWRKVSSSLFGINGSQISTSTWTVLRILKMKGFDSYLVGGCVRDLILNRAPKDFDVITTADLKQVRRLFNRSQIIGKRFPICQVWIRRNIVEVSSFDTVAKKTKENKIDFVAEEKEDDSIAKEKEDDSVAKEEGDNYVFQVPHGFDEQDLIRWRNSVHRDFTINSLFLDPFRLKIYDYVNGMADLKSLKLRTLIPAHLSFKEDCARILRGLRIAARLGLSLSEDTETAIKDLLPSVVSLDQFRLMMEMNYMLSYGAAEPSIHLLQRFNLLRRLLPFQAAYLEQAGKTSGESSMMLMKLFFNMDKLVFCDRPADCRLWIALLAFHIALVNHPQDALVVWAFASILYHGDWEESVKFAREQAKFQVKFVPEISKSSETQSNEELAEKVAHFASLVQDSVHVLTEADGLLESMSRYPEFPCSGLVFIPRKKGKDVAEIFDELVNDVEAYENVKEGSSINYLLLGEGNPRELGFVLGKVVLETMRGSIVRETGVIVKKEDHHTPEICQENCHLTRPDVIKHQPRVKKDKKHGLQSSIPEPKQEMAKRKKQVDRQDGQPEQDTALNHQEGEEANLSAKRLKVVKKARRSHDKVTSKQPKFKLLEEKDRNIVSQEDMVREKTQKQKRVSVKAKSNMSRLASLFK